MFRKFSSRNLTSTGGVPDSIHSSDKPNTIAWYAYLYFRVTDFQAQC